MDWYSVLSDRAQRSGGESGVDTPVLIPNTEVKHSSGENSWACPCEDSTLPGLYRRSYDLLFLSSARMDKRIAVMSAFVATFWRHFVLFSVDILLALLYDSEASVKMSVPHGT